MLPVWLQAGFWGLVGGSALLFGAGLGYFVRISPQAIAAVMAFGAGVLISTLSFELMDEAYQRGGFDSTAIGFLSGAAVYTGANWYLNYQGAKHRKRSGNQQKSLIGGEWERFSDRYRCLAGWHSGINCDRGQHDSRRSC
ncbi:hypothetical protein NDI33_04550 [Trichocoleus sp. DQ-A1]|nr:hypothetical protein [Coleofasciculus sp. FACHB-129]